MGRKGAAMPGAEFHRSMGLAVRARLQRVDSEEAWILGAQGPDPLFFHQRYHPWRSGRVRTLGNRMHGQRTADFLIALLTGAETEAQWAYACGFLTHYAADTTVHPFVYAWARNEDGTYCPPKHNILEAAWDTWTWQQSGGADAPKYYRTMPGKTELAEIAALTARAAAAVFPEYPVTAADIRRAYLDVRRCERILNSLHGRRRRFFRLLERLMKKPDLITQIVPPIRLPEEDILNEGRSPWANPWLPETVRTESVPDLRAAAEALGAELVLAAERFRRKELTAEAMADLLGDRHYSSGLPWQETGPIPKLYRRPGKRA